MQATKFIWKNGNLVAWEIAQTHVLTHGLHYGSGIFEGLRVYKTSKGPAIFKLQEHIARFFYSAKNLEMEIPYSEAVLCQAVIETVRINDLEAGYIRPFAFYSYGEMKLVPENISVDVAIACWPWGKYLPSSAIDVVTSSYIRIHPQSTITDAKISGHYVNSILATLAIQKTHYHEALLCDANGFAAECTSANIFMIKDGKLITPPKGTILMGITRSTILEIAKDFGIAVEERYFKPEEIYTADEVFCCGTAVEITAIRSLDDHLIAQGKTDSITEKMTAQYQKIVHGEISKYHDALTWTHAAQAVAV